MQQKNLATYTEHELEAACATREGIADITRALCTALNSYAGNLYTSTAEMNDALSGRGEGVEAWDKLQKDLRTLGLALRDADRIFTVVEHQAYTLNRRNKNAGD